MKVACIVVIHIFTAHTTLVEFEYVIAHCRGEQQQVDNAASHSEIFINAPGWHVQPVKETKVWHDTRGHSKNCVSLEFVFQHFSESSAVIR